jgi:hypothetical protein
MELFWAKDQATMASRHGQRAETSSPPFDDEASDRAAKLVRNGAVAVTR